MRNWNWHVCETLEFVGIRLIYDFTKNSAIARNFPENLSLDSPQATCLT